MQGPVAVCAPRSPAGPRAGDRTRIIAEDLPHAIGRGEMYVVYQPKCHLPDRELVGFEALVRWDHPDLGHISPALFLPMAEASDGDVVFEIGTHVRQSVASTQILARSRGLALLPVAINVSANELDDVGFADRFIGSLTSIGLPLSCVAVEMTETGVAANPGTVLRNLRRFREAGLDVAMDDFGVGQSGLAQLAKLAGDAVSTIKIDRQFVMEMTADWRALHMVKSIVDMARGLELKLVAEGIETEAQAQLLTDLGVEVGQGYLLGRPAQQLDALSALPR